VITTYAELQTAIANWLNRSDLTAIIPDFIALAEERMNRTLRVRQMETELDATAITDNRIAVPADTAAVKTLWLPNYEATPLKTQSFESVLAKGREGMPTAYAWQGSDFYFDGSGDVQGVLYEKIPALSDSNTSNWLLAAHPSSYLFGALYEAAVYVKDVDSAIGFNQRFTATLDEIAGGDKRDTLSGPLVARAR
jgi:hypothetical protein